MSNREPNWEKLRNINQRAESVHAAGHMNHATWNSFMAEAEAASGGNVDFTEFMYRFADSDWLKPLFAEPKTKRTRKSNRAA